jgi:hypothetical protein
MKTEVIRYQDPRQDRPPGPGDNDLEARQDFFCQPSPLPWDEIVKKWPRERFPSFFSMDQRA